MKKASLLEPIGLIADIIGILALKSMGYDLKIVIPSCSFIVLIWLYIAKWRKCHYLEKENNILTESGEEKNKKLERMSTELNSKNLKIYYFKEASKLIGGILAFATANTKEQKLTELRNAINQTFYMIERDDIDG